MASTNQRKTPETLTAVGRAATLQREGKLPVLSLTPNAPSPTRAQASRAAYDDKVKASMGPPVALPTRPAGPVRSLDPKADFDDSFSMLPITELEAYRHNPRTGRNPRYEDIKASIMADGITNPITVTRPDHTSKYHPYGGGNTRLEIARELFEAGDDRFSNLKVIVKAWPGHANVISAHLSENENRGDISFWERAQGVADFKQQFEAEHRTVLSTGELARELKLHGINFGVKVIQNFSFAVEHLHPVGPWLASKEVNEVLRPGVAGAIAVAQKFDQVSTHLFAPVLLSHRDRLLQAMATQSEAAKLAGDEVKPKPVELDAAALVIDLHQALATAVGVSPEVVPLMISAVESNSRITADELRAIQIRRPEPAGASLSGAIGPAIAPTSAPIQRSLSGMLGGVQPPSTASPGPVTAGGVHSLQTPTEQHSGGGHSPAIGVAQELAPSQRNPRMPAQIAQDDPTVHVLSLVLDISDMVVLHDCILHVPGMPFGYMMDLPESLENIGDKTLPYPQLRAAAWKFLASVSCQVDPIWFTFTGPHVSQWAQKAVQGPDAFRQAYAQSLRGFTSDSGDPALLLAEVYLVLNQPELGYLVVQLLRAMEQLRLNHPERFTRALQPDPDMAGLPD